MNLTKNIFIVLFFFISCKENKKQYINTDGELEKITNKIKEKENLKEKK
ncbi:MAG: hypothetical protein L3J23_06175 [Flavobacteriaceae bacterium]|nr:hypothetical protein [Flavobacteriaceae bacterium]